MPTDAIRASESFVRIPDGELYVKHWAPDRSAAQPPLVLLHDSIGCVATWGDFPCALAGRLQRPVIAYDRLGFGRSSARHGLLPTGFIAEKATTSMPAIRAQLGFDTFLPFGHSVGGAMAIVIAATCPDHCVAVISESAQFTVEERTLAAIATARARFDDARQLTKLERFHGPRVRWVLDAWAGVWLSPAMQSWNIHQELSMLRCPLLALHGDLDEYGSPPRSFDAMVGTAKDSILATFEQSGHVPHREQEGLVIDTVERFLEQLSL